MPFAEDLNFSQAGGMLAKVLPPRCRGKLPKDILSGLFKRGGEMSRLLISMTSQTGPNCGAGYWQEKNPMKRIDGLRAPGQERGEARFLFG